MSNIRKPSSDETNRDEATLNALNASQMKAQQQQNILEYAEEANKTKQRAEKAAGTFYSLENILNHEQINTLTDKMAREIYQTLKGTAPLVLTLYPQGAHFSNHLTKKLGDLNLILEENYLDLKVEEDKITPLVEPLVNLEGRTILIVDAAIKDGRKMQAALDYCKARGARAVFCATLIDMPSARSEQHKALQPSFNGAVCPNLPLAGFGFDIDGFFRNQPGLWTLPANTSRATSSSTSSIITAMEKETALLPQPLVFQEHIPANEKALANARQAEQTFAKLDLLYNQQQLKDKIKLTAQQLEAALKGSNPVVLSMQKGGSHFTTYLTEHMPSLVLEESYMHITRYGNSHHGGKAKVLAAPAVDIKGRTVLISEDLIEGGLTIQLAISLCLEKGAQAVYIASMGDKPQKRLAGLDFIKPDFYCYTFDDRFLVGTGLDERENLRNKFGVWAHKKQQSQNKWWEYGKYVVAGATLLGAGLFAAYQLSRQPKAAATAVAAKLKI
jgi:hypoxanthine phosphoribosyltransferase